MSTRQGAFQRTLLHLPSAPAKVATKSAWAGKILSKLDDLPPGASRALGSVDEVLSASRKRMTIPNRIVQQTVDDYITDNLARLKAAGGRVVHGGPAPKGGLQVGSMNPSTKTITLYAGHEIQDLVEELAHFRQAQRDGFWGSDKKIPRAVAADWKRGIDNLFQNLGFVPR